jgi:mono/diheme cytochrome c family protein
VTATTITIGILAIAAVGVLFYLLMSASKQRGGVAEMPPGMRPGYSDEQLERRVLERNMLVGVVLTLFFAAFFPIYWAVEHGRLSGEAEVRFVAQTVAGEALYQDLCAECHGSNAQGGGAPSPYDPESLWPAPNLTNVVARNDGNENILDIRSYIRTTIHQGRPGTPMPAWGQEAGGPLTDEEIESITAWILANQVEEVAEATSAAGMTGEELYQENCAKCHGPDLLGPEAEGEGTRPGPSLVRVTERHTEESILGILRNGIFVPTGTKMPPWQSSYMYEDARYTDEALERIVEYLTERQAPDVEPRGDGDGEDGGEDDEEPIEARGPSGEHTGA